jgi:Protein of unknown function (DUF1759).
LQDSVTFKDTFLSLVGDSTTIPNIPKCHYLLPAINGYAVIKHIPVSEQGFRSAWEILVERYENERLIINTHTENIKVPNLTSENAGQLRHIADTTQCNLQALWAMKQNTDSWDMIIIYTLTQKLNNKTKKGMGTSYFQQRTAKLNQLYTFLEHRCSALESVSTKYKTNDQRQSSDRKMSHSYVSVKAMCEVCIDSHTVSQCNTFKQSSNNEKYKIVKNNRLCINCLSNKHMIKTQSHSCKICRKWHQTFIHRDKEHSNKGQKMSQQQQNVQVT